MDIMIGMGSPSPEPRQATAGWMIGGLSLGMNTPAGHSVDASIPDHLLPFEIDNACEHIRVELRVLDVTVMLGETLGREHLGLSLASFIPPSPPSFDVLSFVYPWLSHSLHHIGSFRG